MPRRKLSLTDGGTSAQVTLPKGDLERDELVDENGEIIHAFAHIDRVGEREFRIELVEPDELPRAEGGSQ